MRAFLFRFLRVGLAASLLAAMIGGGIWWFGRDRTPPRVELSFPDPAVVRVCSDRSMTRLRIGDIQGRILFAGEVPPRTEHTLPAAWRAGATYRVWADGQRAGEFAAPETTPDFAITAHAPLGAEPWRRVFSPGVQSNAAGHDFALQVAKGSQIDVLIEVERLAPAAKVSTPSHEADSIQRFSTILHDPPGAVVVSEPPLGSFELREQFDKWFFVLTLQRQSVKSVACELALFRDDEGADAPPWRLRFWLTDETLADDAVTLRDWQAPTRADGGPEPAALPNELVVPGKAWRRLGPWLGAPSAAPRFYHPYAYQTVWLENRSQSPAPVVVTSSVLNSQTGEPSADFATPRNESRGGLTQTLSYVTIPPLEAQAVTLPIYLAPDTPPGEYRRRLTVAALSGGRVWIERSAPLAVIRPRAVYLVWIAGAALLAVVWLGTCLIGYRCAIRSFGLRRLTLLALMGALQFAVTFVSGTIAAALQAALGPFNVLAGRLLTSLATHVPLAATVTLVPRVGAVTIAGTITYLMGGMLLGAFGLVDLVFFASAVAVREIMLLVCGVSRFGDSKSGEGTGASAMSRRLWPGVLPLVFALALAEAVNAFTTIASQATLYRFYFASWYVWLSVVVAGFLYTLPGAWLGARLGRELKRLQA